MATKITNQQAIEIAIIHSGTLLDQIDAEMFSDCDISDEEQEMIMNHIKGIASSLLDGRPQIGSTGLIIKHVTKKQ